MELLFRRGKLASLLADSTIKPGTISITTDEPGLYLDLDVNEAGDGQPAKRVRIGDFIVAASLDSLKADAAAGKKFSTHALYYSEAENMLMRYNGSTFVWINSYEDVKANVGTLQEDMSTAQGDISNISKALAQELLDRAAGDQHLQDQINAIQGTTGNGISVTSLKAALDAEIEARSTKDTELVADISTINATLQDQSENISGNTEAIAGINTLLGSLPEDDTTTTIVQYFTDKVAAEEARAKAAEEANAAAAKAADNRVAAEEGTRASEVIRLTGLIETAQQTAQKGVDDAATEKTAREQADIAINGRIDGLSSTVGGHTTAIAENLAAINENKGAITELGKKDEALQQLIEANTKAIADEADRADKAEKKIADDLSTAKTQLTNSISEVDGKVDSTASTIRSEMATMKTDIEAGYAAAYQVLLNQINENIAAANAMTFMGEIDNFDDIPNTGTKAGDMYVVINPDLNPGWNIGDLLVIKADGLTFASNADKINGVIHVETGYHTFNDARLKADGNKVQLQSHLGRDLGSIEVKAAANSNVIVTLEKEASSSGTGEACAITVGLAWGTF